MGVYFICNGHGVWKNERKREKTQRGKAKSIKGKETTKGWKDKKITRKHPESTSTLAEREKNKENWEDKQHVHIQQDIL